MERRDCIIISTPNSVIDKIYDAVREAIEYGVDPRTFVKEVRDSWRDELDDAKLMDMKTFDEILKGSLMEKKILCVLKAFYRDGMKTRVDLTMTRDQVREEFKQARMNNRNPELACVENDDKVEDSSMIINMNQLLFAVLELPKTGPSLVIAPAGSVPGSQL